jgi:hypothetical protein
VWKVEASQAAAHVRTCEDEQRVLFVHSRPLTDQFNLEKAREDSATAFTELEKCSRELDETRNSKVLEDLLKEYERELEKITQ